MGEIIKADSRRVLPTQMDLNRCDFRKLLAIYDENNFENVFPCIARQINQYSYALIEGAHRTVFHSVLGWDVKLYVPKNRFDLISTDLFPRDQREFVDDANESIKRVFSDIPFLLGYARKFDIRSIDDLRGKYGIKTIDDIRKFADADRG